MPNVLDRAIAWFSPERGARRLAARAAAAQLALSAQQYGGAVRGVRSRASSREGTLVNWDPRRVGEHEEPRDFFLSMRRAESLVSEDANAVSAIDALCLNIVGGGMRPQSRPDFERLGITEEEAGAFAASAEAAWQAWCREADATCAGSFEDVQYEAVRSLLVMGEILHVLEWNEGDGRLFGLCLRSLHPSRLRTPSDLASDKSIRCGVKLGAYGQPVRYYIARPEAGGFMEGLPSSHFLALDKYRRGHLQVLHAFRRPRPEAVRGESVLAPAMKQFRDLSTYVDYELVGAMIAASFTVFMETMPSSDVFGNGFAGSYKSGGAAPERQEYKAVSPGSIMVGNAGDKPHLLSSNRPGSTFDSFYERMLRAVAASTGQPYESVARDFSKTNYSSARAALLEVWKVHRLYQDWFIRSVLSPYWEMAMEEACLRGMLELPSRAAMQWEDPSQRALWLHASWSRPPRGHIDPVKEREADALGLQNGTDTLARICADQGTDWEEVLHQRKREQDLCERLGLKQNEDIQARRGLGSEENGEDDAALQG